MRPSLRKHRPSAARDEPVKPDRETLELGLESVPGARKAPLARLRSPQLATLATSAPEGDAWLNEIKFDGYRLVAMIDSGTARLLTRYGKDWTEKFPSLRAALEQLPVRQAVLDGEVVVLDERGVSSFQALQNALDGAEEAALVYYVFDMPYCQGFDLTRTPLSKRKELLKRICDALEDETRPVRFSDHVLGKGAIFHEQACENALEGAMAKRADSPYEQRRSASWVKVKCSKRQEFVIGGYTRPGGSRTAFGALLLGYYDDDGRLISCGRVGTGFTDKLLGRILAELEARVQEEPPFRVPPKGREARDIQHWVRPELVAEVEFTGWTEDGLLRHPSFKGLRSDKNPREVRREEPAARAGDAGRARGRPDDARQEEGESVTTGTLSHPDRVVYPARGLTKRELAEYYETVSEWILPHIVKRPLMVLRCPQGQQSHCFYQKHVNEAFPDTIRSIPIEEGGEVHGYIALDDQAGLLALVQLGMLEIHSWASPESDVEKPDRIIFDLDPGPGVAWAEVIDAAQLLRGSLNDQGLQSFVKTSGSKGFHIVAPIRQQAPWDQAKGFARMIAEDMVRENPGRFIATASKAKREGKIFLDFFRTGRGSTCVAAYSTRARPGATVSTPLSWEELPGCPGPGEFTVENIPERLAKLKADPWAGFFSVRQTLPAPTS